MNQPPAAGTPGMIRAVWTRTILLAVFSAVAASGVIQAGETPESWYREGQQAIREARRLKDVNRSAKNVILFIGDGMGISTVTAARILEGQLLGHSGEENSLSFEKFPHLALSKTYSVNQQTPDSAPTMTAMVTGVKTCDGMLAVNQYAVRGDYTTVTGNELITILEIAEKNGKSSGVVSTARITHATPAACYAHSPERNWESDADLPADALAAGFPDIARELIEFPYGDGLEVALGGGRRNFRPDTMPDPEDKGAFGCRKDGRDLTAEWRTNHLNSAFVWNKAQLDAIDPSQVDHLLGLFEQSHMEYEYDRPADVGGEPSLADMTSKAIDILSRNRKGYFLMVEGGRIDHAHHAGNAFRALVDTIALSDAVRAAVDKVDPKETLIIVGADHSHVFTIGGYPGRGNDILGKVVDQNGVLTKDSLGLPYTTLAYANGPGYRGGRMDLSNVDTAQPDFLQEATVPLENETHAGEDVAVFAAGPGAHLFHGVREQNYIFHVMMDAWDLDELPYGREHIISWRR